LSRPLRVWLLQSPEKYFSVVPVFLKALRKTKYFDGFYVATEKTVWLGTDCWVIDLKKDNGWSNNIIKTLEYVKEDVFFMGCEDHILTDFDETLVDAAFWAVKYIDDIGCVRLTHKPRIPLDTDDPISPIGRSYLYYVSLQPTIWKKSYLEKIIRPDETAWEFEIKAGSRAKRIKDINACCVRKTIFNYKNLMEKGVLAERDDYVKIHG